MLAKICPVGSRGIWGLGDVGVWRLVCLWPRVPRQILLRNCVGGNWEGLFWVFCLGFCNFDLTPRST